MRRLRQKVEVDPNRPAHIITVRGVGYRLVATTTGPSADTPAAGG
jgi:DNA-binding response OmpR family regulator